MLDHDQINRPSHHDEGRTGRGDYEGAPTGRGIYEAGRTGRSDPGTRYGQEPVGASRRDAAPAGSDSPVDDDEIQERIDVESGITRGYN